jgi:hypothetical protein
MGAPMTSVPGQSGVAYDSRPATWEHIHQVQALLWHFIGQLQLRAHAHDQSKLNEPERSVFNEYTPKLRDSTYGSDEYKGYLAGMGRGLQHHYQVNDHHPEHFTFGIHDMNLLQLVEMLADWKAATMRHADGDLGRSIKQNVERFSYGLEIENLLTSTARDLGWL